MAIQQQAQDMETSFLIMSDTHNLETATVNPEACPLANKMPKVDVLLHCGDITQVGGLSDYEKALRLISSYDAELKLVIGGNHDLSLDEEYWRTYLDEDDDPEEHEMAITLMTRPLAQEAGIVCLTEGTHTFTLENGTTFSIFASPYQPECGDWAFGYPRTRDHFGQANIPDNVDIVMTHGPPAGCLDLIPSKQDSAGCHSLFRAVQSARPKLHCFGHIHEGYGHIVQRWEPDSPHRTIEKALEVTITKAGLSDKRVCKLDAGHETFMVNAAIMDGYNRPINAPWLGKVPLPSKKNSG